MENIEQQNPVEDRTESQEVVDSVAEFPDYSTKTLKEITEVKDRNISLAEIVSALITVGSDWREELLKNNETRGLESKLHEKYKGVTVEIEPAKEKTRGKYMIEDRDRDDEEMEL